MAFTGTALLAIVWFLQVVISLITDPQQTDFLALISKPLAQAHAALTTASSALIGIIGSYFLAQVRDQPISNSNERDSRRPDSADERKLMERQVQSRLAVIQTSLDRARQQAEAAQAIARGWANETVRLRRVIAGQCSNLRRSRHMPPQHHRPTPPSTEPLDSCLAPPHHSTQRTNLQKAAA